MKSWGNLKFVQKVKLFPMPPLALSITTHHLPPHERRPTTLSPAAPSRSKAGLLLPFASPSRTARPRSTPLASRCRLEPPWKPPEPPSRCDTTHHGPGLRPQAKPPRRTSQIKQPTVFLVRHEHLPIVEPHRPSSSPTSVPPSFTRAPACSTTQPLVATTIGQRPPHRSPSATQPSSWSGFDSEIQTFQNLFELQILMEFDQINSDNWIQIYSLE
jgi:hypothetical protein